MRFNTQTKQKNGVFNRQVCWVIFVKYGWVFLLALVALRDTSILKNMPTLQFVIQPSHISKPKLDSANLHPTTPTYLTVSDPNQAPSVHAASITQINQNTLQAVWFGGLREGAKDVAIYTNTFDLSSRQWGIPKKLLTRQQLEQHSGIYIKKLGNPLLYHSATGDTHLFVVGVSLGGWAGSRLYHFINQGEGFVYHNQLLLSPLLNNSHLVRTAPLPLKDGGFYLPIYHEFTQKYELLLRFNKQGDLLTAQRPNTNTKILQPAITALSKDTCLLIRRNQQPNTPMLLQPCQTNVPKFGNLQATSLNNDNSSVALINYHGKPLIIHNTALLHNDGTDFINTRYHLMLSAIDGTAVSTIMTIDTAGTKAGQVSYPTALVVNDELHILYTYDRQTIKHAIIPSSLIGTYFNSTTH